MVALAALTLATLVGAALVPALSSGRSVQDKIEAKRKQLERVEDRESNMQATISGVNKKLRGLRVEIGSLQRQEDRAAAELSRREDELAEATDRYEVEHRRFVRLREQLREAQGVLAERLVQIYKSDEPDMMTVLLESDGFEDLLTRSEYINRIGDGDKQVVLKVKGLKIESSKQRELLVDLKERAEIAVEAVANRKRELTETRGELSDRESELASTRAEQKKVLSSVQRDKHEVKGDLTELSAQVESQLGSGQQIAGPIRQGSGQFIWPITGTLTSSYCERRSWEACHPGIDIAAPTGTPIRAADDGTVQMAGPQGGYGNFTCIGHGGGLSSCYGHQNSIGVSTGQNVSKGDVIGTVGSTGFSTGPHVHFEVRANGAVQNPMSYL